MTENSKPAFVFERDRSERADTINDFYNSFTGRNRKVEDYLWEFYQGPGGPGLVWTITERSTDEIVGHHGIVPTPMICQGEIVSGGRTENTMVAQRIRRKIFYPGMERRALSETLESIRMIYTPHPDGGPAPIRIRFGYKAIGPLDGIPSQSWSGIPDGAPATGECEVW